MNEDIENAKILLNWLKDENWQYFHEDGEPYKTISMQDRDILIKYITQLQTNWNELNKFIEEEKNRLATQVSNTYEDSLDKIHFVNEDIFNELTKVSEKMQELERGKE